MSDLIDKANAAQMWLMKYYRQWTPLDVCIELVKEIDKESQQEVISCKVSDEEEPGGE
jgi:hypothetical protein